MIHFSTRELRWHNQVFNPSLIDVVSLTSLRVIYHTVCEYKRVLTVLKTYITQFGFRTTSCDRVTARARPDWPWSIEQFLIGWATMQLVSPKTDGNVSWP